MLGAQLEDLGGLADRLRATSADINTVQGEATRVSDTVVTSVRDAAHAALTQISGAMDRLRVAVAASTQQSEATNWTGANREVFVGANADFDAAMAQAEGATNDTFQRFEAAIESMAAGLEEYAAVLDRSLTDAQTSTTSMAAAVDAQRVNLETVMNTGLTVS